MFKEISGYLARLLILCGLVFVFPVPPGLADGGEGGTSRKTSRYDETPPKVKKSYSQKEFSRLSQRELDWLVIYNPLVDGFSVNMGLQLVRVAKDARRNVQRLVRDMQRLQTTEKRVNRLRKELKKAEKAENALKKSLERIGEKKLGRGATRETIDRYQQAYEYVQFLKQWIKSPSEGI